MAVLTTAEADAAIARLSAEHDTISESLLELDGNMGRKLLDGAALAGVTKQLWEATNGEIAELWARFDVYRSVIARITDVRAAKSRLSTTELEQLTRLLTGPAATLPGPEVPLERRTLTGPSHPGRQLTLAQLVAEMKASYARVIEVVGAADQVWSELTPRVDACREQLAAARQLADGLSLAEGADPAADALAAAARDLDALRGTLRVDPLKLWSGGAVQTQGADRVAAALSRTHADLQELAAVRDHVEARLTAITATQEQIAGLEADARRVRDDVAVAIGPESVPQAPAQPRPPLDARAVRDLRERGRWRGLAEMIDELERDAAAALEHARTQLAALRRPLDDRAELRGRLDAYRAKAVRSGRAEDAGLDRLYREAHELLWTAPCDLAAAAAAVARYQEAMR